MFSIWTIVIHIDIETCRAGRSSLSKRHQGTETAARPPFERKIGFQFPILIQ